MDSTFKKLAANSDLAMAIGIIAILGVMVIPLPSFLIDLMICLGIAGALVMLLTSVYVGRALDFSLFPSLLLIMTLFRLSLNVATTRAILLRGGTEGIAAAGSVIRIFGDFVVGGNYAVGIVVFTILVIINFIVITKGAGRVAEVAARFTLDAMPGKQMAIDADLNSGLITEERARERRDEIAREADFYGSMDGASKFVRGDAIAGILIVFVNVIGGIVIGTLQQGMNVADAAQVFTLLTIGDGLVSQIPALIVSTAAGIIVTRTASGRNLGDELGKQLISQPKALLASGGVMAFMGVLTPLPTVPFLVLAGILSGAYYQLNLAEKKRNAAKSDVKTSGKVKTTEEKLQEMMSVDTLKLEVGYGLISVVDGDDGSLADRIAKLREGFAMDMGIIIPMIRINDNLELDPDSYQILLKGIPIATGRLKRHHMLALDPGGVSQEIEGIPTTDPAYGLEALWISDMAREEAESAGYTVVTLPSVIMTHIQEVIRQNAHELLGREEVQDLVDNLKHIAPKVVEDLIPKVLSIGDILKVLRALVREGVSVRDLRSILEALADNSTITKDTETLTEYVRAALARNITKSLVHDEDEMTVITLERDIEETIAQSIVQTEEGQVLSVDPDYVRKLISGLNSQISAMANMGESDPIVICSPLIRRHLKKLLDRFLPNVVVLSHNEITTNVEIKTFGTVRLAHGG